MLPLHDLSLSFSQPQIGWRRSGFASGWLIGSTTPVQWRQQDPPGGGSVDDDSLQRGEGIGGAEPQMAQPSRPGSEESSQSVSLKQTPLSCVE